MFCFPNRCYVMILENFQHFFQILDYSLHMYPRGTLHLKGVGMLFVSLRGINFGFWSHLGCSGQNAIIFSREGLV